MRYRGPRGDEQRDGGAVQAIRAQQLVDCSQSRANATSPVVVIVVVAAITIAIAGATQPSVTRPERRRTR
jgi:hypothetical protein